MNEQLDLPKRRRRTVRSWLLIGLLLSAWTAAAQAPRTVTVDLKNGTSLTGEMAVTVQKDYLTLMRENQPLLHIPYRKIRYVYFGTDPERVPAAPRQFLRQNRQFFHQGELNVMQNNRPYTSATGVGVHTVNGYHFNPHLGVGLGVGIDYYDPIYVLPVYVSVRGVLTKWKLSPYYFANAGRSRGWASDSEGRFTDLSAQGGWMLQGGVGYQINFRQSALLIHVGLKSQQTEMNYQLPWWIDSAVEEKRTYRRVSLGIGLML
ncbi:MAG: hypothetical protein WA958_13480 [Tunicatimonas sp.]